MEQVLQARNLHNGEYYKIRPIDNNTYEIDGYDPEPHSVMPGSVVDTSSERVSYTITEIVKRRNHAGQFKDENKRVNAFFTARAILNK